MSTPKFEAFASPHVHIQSLDSASTPAAFAAKEVELGTGSIVVTDHGSLAACQTVYELGKKNGLIPVLGLEGYFRDDCDPLLLEAGIPQEHPINPRTKEFDTSKPKGHQNYLKYKHFTCHFLDWQAYLTGVKLLSRAPTERHGSEDKPLFDWAAMEELGAANVTIGSSCLIGFVARHLLVYNDPVMAEKYYQRLRSIVRPGNFFIEAFPNICTRNWVEGVFLTLRDPNGDEREVKWYAKKNLKTNAGEIKAIDLVKAFERPDCPHRELIAIKNYSSWEDLPPAKIIRAVYREEYYENDCTPYAPNGDVQLGANKFVLELAQKYGDPIIPSDDAHLAKASDKIIQDVRLSQAGSWRFAEAYNRKSSAEAFEYFKTHMGISEAEFGKWVDNSRAWASRFKDFKFETKVSLPTKFYESKYTEVGAKNSLDYTMHLIQKHGRMDWGNQAYRDRLNKEIKLLYDNGTIDLLSYFMVDEEIVDLYEKNGLLTGPLRGSAGGVLLSYLLGITHVDPLKYNLSLDRFITLTRIQSGKMPDLDQDLPNRDLLVGEDGKGGWLQERFGDHVAQISTITTLKLKSAILDVARFTLGSVPKEIAALAHKMEVAPQGLEDIKFVLGYEDSDNWIKGSIEYDPNLREYISRYPDQWEIVKQCLGLGRSLGRHPCAFAICNKPLPELGIPLATIGGVRCTAFTASAVEATGALKFDFLVINSLNDLSEAIKSVQKRSGLEIPQDGAVLDGKWVPRIRMLPLPNGGVADVWDLPPDQDVFADVACGKTETVFQFDTNSAKQGLRHFSYRRKDGQFAINSIEAMAAFTALDRPGPLDSYVKTPGEEDSRHNMLVEYARRARGAAPSPEILPVFDQMFPETLGLLVFQETMERAYRELTGCGPSEAEEFRSNVAKKKKQKIIEAYPSFIERASRKLESEALAVKVWENFNNFGAYGFNKCVTGDTIVIRPGANLHCEPEICIRDLYKASQSDTPWGEKIRGGRLNLLQMDDDGRIRPGRLKKIHHNGKRTVFEIRLSNGRSIRATANHRFLTSEGYKTVSRLSFGDLLLTMGQDPKKKNIRGGNERAKGRGYDGCGMPTGEDNPAWIDGRTNLLKDAQQIVGVRAGGFCEICKIAKGTPKHSFEFAHTKPLEECGGDFSVYHNHKNLRHLCNPCHKAFDYKKGERKKRWTKGVPTELVGILEIKEDGQEDVYDVEMDTVAHNFIANGIVSHNSHATGYAILGYACAYLKHHYSLEWWAAVLKHADKNEINEKFWKHCGHLIDLPDVTNACTSFELRGSRIQAPLSLLKGVGPIALKELIAGAPYTDIKDYVLKREAYKKSGEIVSIVDEIKTVTVNGIKEKVITGRQVEKISKGRSALGNGITYRLILAGAMDQLFPNNTDTLGMMHLYEQTVLEVENEIRAARKPKPKSPKKNPDKVPEQYVNLTNLVRYQIRKTILPAHSESVRSLLLDRNHPRVKRSTNEISFGKYEFVTGQDLVKRKSQGVAKYGERVVVAGYVEEVRPFEWGEKDAHGYRPDPKHACEIIVDLDGERTKLVAWPNRDTNSLDSQFNTDLKGAIIVLNLVRYKAGKPYSIEAVEIVQKPLGEPEEAPEAEESK